MEKAAKSGDLYRHYRPSILDSRALLGSNLGTNIVDESDILPLLEDVLPDGKGMLVMLKGYLDLGGKGDHGDEVACVGCVVFKPVRYKQFIRSWKRALKTWGASAFHATDFYVGAGEFARDTPQKKRLFEEDSKRIPRMIGEAIYHVEMVSWRPREFEQAASPQWKAKFGDSIHSQGVQLALIANGWWRQERCRRESFAYFMETGDPGQNEIQKTVEAMRNDQETETAKVIGVSSFTTVEKGRARGLEAADFVAWHWNKYYMDSIRVGKEDHPRKDFRAFVEACKERPKYIFLTGDMLKYFFSLVPPAVLGKQIA